MRENEQFPNLSRRVFILAGGAAVIAAACSVNNPTPIPTLEISPSPTPEPTRTPRPTKTPRPTPTPEPTENFERNIEGLVYPGDLILDDTSLIPEGVACIDIDDGIYAEENMRALQTSDEYGDRAPINWFLNSTYFDQYHIPNQEALREIAARGFHAIENHTDTHPFLTQLASKQVKPEMAKQQRKLSEVLGYNLREDLFKPPFIDIFVNGQVDPDITFGARDLGLAIILAGIDPNGYELVGREFQKGKNYISFEDQIKIILKRVKKGVRESEAAGGGVHITLHGNANDIESLPGIFDFLLSEGYAIKTLRDALPLARKDSRTSIPTPHPKIDFESPIPSSEVVYKNSNS